MMNNESVVVHHLVAMSLTAMQHLDSMLERSVVGGGGIAHLSLSLPVFVHRCLPSFVSHGGSSLSFICCFINSVDDVSLPSGRHGTSIDVQVVLHHSDLIFTVVICPLGKGFIVPL
jgi:hypothetical protein